MCTKRHSKGYTAGRPHSLHDSDIIKTTSLFLLTLRAAWGMGIEGPRDGQIGSACFEARTFRYFFQEVFLMAKSIYVGNLPWSATEEQVQDLFSPFGPVLSVKLVSDRDTGRARGFGFVEMDDAEAVAAIEALDNASFGGRTLRVNEARPRAPRAPRY